MNLLILKMIKISAFLVLFAACSVGCNMISSCGHEVVCNPNLGVQINTTIIAKIPKCLKKEQDCTDHLQMGRNVSGIYEIWPMSRLIKGKSIKVYCDMETDGGGWTVIQRRGDFKNPIDYFARDWKSYKEGFGDKDKDFWLGNDNIFALTHQKLYSVRFDLKDFEQNERYALYQKFWIDDENHKYMLHITDYSGDAGDSMEYHNNRAFAANKGEQFFAASVCKGQWWCKDDQYSNLNGMYFQGNQESNGDGIHWIHWKGHQESLYWTEIKIRPKLQE